MTCCIFAGPSLFPRDREMFAQAHWLPPAKQGDVYRVVELLGPSAIGVIDGYFRWAPAVWHKELLWALHHGIKVFGAASMGALRAAELAPYGMTGVGRIFDAYRTGRLHPYAEPFEDDDEVAVVHGPPESGYLAGSEAMVNIRITLAAAERQGIIDADVRSMLVSIAKGMFFPERSYDALFARAHERGVAAAAVDALGGWLPQGRINQKRLDALQLVEAMRSLALTDSDRVRPNFDFQYTTLWHQAAAGALARAVHDEDEARVLAELRVEGIHYLKRLSQARELLGERSPCATSPSGVLDGSELLVRRERDRALQHARNGIPEAIVERRLLAELRKSGEYEDVRRRALAKARHIGSLAGLPDVREFVDLKLLQLEDWYFTQCQGMDIPDDLDEFLDRLGYADRAAFHRAVFHEYVYRQSGASPEVPSERSAVS